MHDAFIYQTIILGGLCSALQLILKAPPVPTLLAMKYLFYYCIFVLVPLAYMLEGNTKHFLSYIVPFLIISKQGQQKKEMY